jgi:hypothetical protein
MQKNDRIVLNIIIAGSVISIVCLVLSFALLFYNNINFSFDNWSYILDTILPVFVLLIIAFFGGIITLVGIVLHLTRDKKKELNIIK